MKKESPFELINKSKVWDEKDGDKYLVTGVDRDGRKFKYHFESWRWASGVNVWNGCKWLIRNGKRHLIQKVSN